MSARAFGSPSYPEHFTRSLPLDLQGTTLPQPPLSPQATPSDLLAPLADIQAPGMKAWPQTKCPGPGTATCQIALTTRLGQLAQAFLLPQVVLCLREVFLPTLFTVLGGPRDGQLALTALCDPLASCTWTSRNVWCCSARGIIPPTRPLNSHVCFAGNLWEQKTNRPPVPSF